MNDENVTLLMKNLPKSHLERLDIALKCRFETSSEESFGSRPKRFVTSSKHMDGDVYIADLAFLHNQGLWQNVLPLPTRASEPYFVNWNTIRKNGRICTPKSKVAVMACIQEYNALRLSPAKFVITIRVSNDIWKPLVRDTLRIQREYESQGVLGIFLKSSVKLANFESSLDWHDSTYCITLYEVIFSANNADQYKLQCPKGTTCVCTTFGLVRKALQGLIDTDISSSMLL